MTLALSCIAWVFASAIVAMLPMRLQYLPGVLLLIAAPALIVWIGLSVGLIAGLASALAFVSMFRNPLRYIVARLRGQNPEVPQ